MAVDVAQRRGSTGAGVVPRLYDALVWPAERAFIGRWRRRLSSRAAAGAARLLEIGAGTGAGFRALPPGARVVALEPASAMAARARVRAAMAGRRGVAAQVVEGRAEQLPFADASFDAVLATFVWCSVADPERAFAEARRVLRPGGRLYLLEHVHNRWQPARALQTLFAPAWRRVAGGCRLDQDTVGLLVAAGLSVERRADHLLGWVVEIEAARR
jgi:ubiquinone/menaquinone biosynthesis C-methylase UbiE